MLIAILITVIIAAAFAYAHWADRDGQAIVRHPYNNVHSDATGAREDNIL